MPGAVVILQRGARGAGQESFRAVGWNFVTRSKSQISIN